MDKVEIPKEELEQYCFYHGEGRVVGNIAMWTGHAFVGIGSSFGRWETNYAEYGERGFSPYTKVTTEGGELASNPSA